MVFGVETYIYIYQLTGEAIMTRSHAHDVGSNPTYVRIRVATLLYMSPKATSRFLRRLGLVATYIPPTVRWSVGMREAVAAGSSSK